MVGLGILIPLLMAGALMALPLFDEDDSNDASETPPDDGPVDPIDPGDGTPPDPIEPEPPAGLDLVLETDPVTGALTVTAGEDQEGELILTRNLSMIIPGDDGVSVDDYYDATLYWVPEGYDLEEAANAMDWYAFNMEYLEQDLVPDLEDYEAALGLTRITDWNLGGTGFYNPDGGYGDPVFPEYWDSRTDLPDITSNLDISCYEMNWDSLGLDSFVTPVNDQSDFDFDFVTRVSPHPPGDPELAEDSYASYRPEDGDVIHGTEYQDVISSPRGDGTEVTIFGGDGTDWITAGLNDTIVTNDDDDNDTVGIGSVLSFGEVYDAAPVLVAGEEDVVSVGGPNTLVISFAQETSPGVTDYFYHVLSAETLDFEPMDALDPADGPVSIQDYYRAAGQQLLATGSLGQLDESDPSNPVDSRVGPPGFTGIDEGFFEATIGVDGITATTDLLPVAGTPVAA